MGSSGQLLKANKGGTASRYRQKVATVFDCLLEIAAPTGESGAFVLWKYPEDFADEGKLKAAAEFAYPAGPDGEAAESVELFTFVLTGTESDYTFGYSRHTPRSNTCLVLLSGLPWTNFFYKLINHFASVMNDASSSELEALLVRAYHTEIPRAGEAFVAESSLGRNKVECVAPDESKLPTLQENKYLQDYYALVADTGKNGNVIGVFVSLLSERRVVITGRRVGQVSHCVLAAERLIHPLFWQYPFVPVLTKHEFLHCPTPFLAGVPAALWRRSQGEVDASELVVLDLDAGTLTSPFPDLQAFPSDILRKLRHNLKHTNHLVGDGLARSFLRALAELLGGYRAGLLKSLEGDGGLTFDYDRFLSAYERRASQRAYLASLRDSQLVQQFLDERCHRLSQGLRFDDPFEEERANLADSFPHAASARDFASSAGLQEAMSSVRDKSMEAFSGLRDSVKTFAKEGSQSLRPQQKGFSRDVGSYVQDKLHRIPSLGGGSQKLRDVEGEEAGDGRSTGSRSSPVAFEAPPPEPRPPPPVADLLDLSSDVKPLPSLGSIGDLDPLHSSRSLSDLLKLDLGAHPPPPQPQQRAKASTPGPSRAAPARPSPPGQRRFPTAGPAPVLHSSASQGSALFTVGRRPASPLTRAPPLASSLGSSQASVPPKPPPAAKPSGELLIDWSADQSSVLAAEFDPLASGRAGGTGANGSAFPRGVQAAMHPTASAPNLRPQASFPASSPQRSPVPSAPVPTAQTPAKPSWETFE